MSLFTELKRRNVLRAAALYVGAVWALSQGLAQLAPYVGLPDWAVTWLLVAAAIGFPFFLAFAWFFEFTPEGLKRESEIDPAESVTAHTGRTMDRWIIAVMAVAIVLLLTNTFVWHKGAGLSGSADTLKAPPNSIAVLPFTNRSTDKNQEFFSDGISEELLNQLAKIPQLQVTARTSSFSFKGTKLAIPDIARQLHVSHILEGSVQKAGNQVRITAQLVDVATDRQLWSQRYDRKLDDIFRIQDEISGDVVKALQVKLLGAAPKARTTDPKAYALYLQAKELSRQYTKEAFAKSDALYRQVLAIDPRYAPAWDGLARIFTNETNYGLLPNREGYARAREADEKALAIDPDYAPAHARLGWIAMYADNDLAGAAKHFEHALALDPTNLGVLGNAATLLQNLGRVDEALALEEAIVRRDPVNVTALFNLGYYQRMAGRYDAAIASIRTVLSLSPGMSSAHYQLGVALLFKHEPKAALAEIEQEKSELWRMIGLPLAYCGLGRKADAEQAFKALIGKHAKDGPYNIAYDHAYCGEADQAFAWLDKAVQYQDPGLGEIVAENLFDKIHADPRWPAFLRKLGKAPDQLAQIKFSVSLPKGWQNGAPE